MLVFDVKDMTCGHCASAIKQAVDATDPGARVQIDLATHRVCIDPVTGSRASLAAAIAAAGYTPVEAQAAAGKTAGPRQGGCCCA